MQVETIEIYTIEISFRQRSVRKLVKFKEKVDISGWSYNIYDNSPYLKKTYWKQVQQWVKKV